MLDFQAFLILFGSKRSQKSLFLIPILSSLIAFLLKSITILPLVQQYFICPITVLLSIYRLYP